MIGMILQPINVLIPTISVKKILGLSADRGNIGADSGYISFASGKAMKKNCRLLRFPIADSIHLSSRTSYFITHFDKDIPGSPIVYHCFPNLLIRETLCSGCPMMSDFHLQNCHHFILLVLVESVSELASSR
jgi:hypothetical protein